MWLSRASSDETGPEADNAESGGLVSCDEAKVTSNVQKRANLLSARLRLSETAQQGRANQVHHFEMI